MNASWRGLAVILLTVTVVASLDTFQYSASQSPGHSGLNGFQGSLSPLASGWTKATHPVHPPALAGSMMTYDSRNNVFVLFGGSDGAPLNQTWILDPKTQVWNEVRPRVSPPARADAMLVYDSAAEAVLLFGGWYETPNGSYHRLGDTWSFFVENGTWIPRNPRTSPAPRSDAAVAYDETEGITLLFGGFDGEHYLGDMWYYAFANDTWIDRPSARLPSPRADGRMTYDPQHRSFFLFSGNDYSDYLFRFHHPADMWRYTWVDNVWTPIFPDQMPMPRDYSVFATNLAFGELLLVGGFGNRTILGDIWTFNTTQLVWRNVSTPGGPSPRMAAVGGYDPVDDVLVLYGGGDDYEVKSDTWFFRYPPPLVGNVVVSSPSPIVGQQVAFSAGIVGGSGTLAQVSWDFGDGQTSKAVSPLHVFGTPGIYRIQFIGQDTRGAQFVWTLDLAVGLFVPFWMDVSILLIGLSALSIFMLVWVRRRLKLVP